jgi:hypothetical protein
MSMTSGAAPQPQFAFCPSCGKPWPAMAGARFCAYCGYQAGIDMGAAAAAPASTISPPPAPAMPIAPTAAPATCPNCGYAKTPPGKPRCYNCNKPLPGFATPPAQAMAPGLGSAAPIAPTAPVPTQTPPPPWASAPTSAPAPTHTPPPPWASAPAQAPGPTQTPPPPWASAPAPAPAPTQTPTPFPGVSAPPVACPKCGYAKTPPGKSRCYNCGASLAG